MDRSTTQKILIGLFLAACIFIGIKTFDINGFNEIQAKTEEVNSNVTSSRMTYGRFLEYLDMGWVKQVDLYDNSRNAMVQASSPELGNRPQSIHSRGSAGATTPCMPGRRISSPRDPGGKAHWGIPRYVRRERNPKSKHCLDVAPRHAPRPTHNRR